MMLNAEVKEDGTQVAKAPKHLGDEKKLPSKIPKFRSDEELAAFMEKYSVFDLLDAGLATVAPTTLFVRMLDAKKNAFEG